MLLEKIALINTSVLASVGIKDSLVLKTDTQKTEKILTRFLLIKRVQACTHSSGADTQAQNG
jgi:hypothetical protein